MKNVSIYRPTTIEEAIRILSMHGTEAGVYAGGTDLLIRLKNRLKQAPSYLVDIKKIDNLRYIRDAQGGVEIGTATKLSEMVESALLQQRYPMLVEAILKISSPELRNVSTLGGDLLQECGASTCEAVIRAGEMVGTCATALSGTTVITTRPWAGGYAMPSIPATPPLR